MMMKRNCAHLLALFLALPAATVAAQEAPHQPMRPVSDCMRIDRINNWAVVDDRTVLVSNGPNRFKVTTESSCPRLGTGNSLRFRAAADKKALGLSAICGETGETVFARDQPPCAIAAVEKIDKQAYDNLAKKAHHHGSAADQPTKPPSGTAGR
jgi:hypothetical protein